MEQVSTREMLQELANLPLGSPELQSQPFDRNGRVKPEVKEVAKRITKVWLPQGKKPPRPRSTCNAPDATQTDLEDAVEAAGGKRGASGIAAATAVETTEIGSTEGKSPTGEAGDAQDHKASPITQSTD